MARTRIRLPRREVVPPRPRSRSDPDAAWDALDPEVDPDGAADPDVETYHRSRRRKESALADLRQLEVLRRAGELIPVAQVSAAWTRQIQRTRSALLAVSSRVRAACPQLDDAVIGIVDREIRSALLMLADDWQAGD